MLRISEEQCKSYFRYECIKSYVISNQLNSFNQITKIKDNLMGFWGLGFLGLGFRVEGLELRVYG